MRNFSYYKRATVHINLNSINSVGSRFEYEEEGVIATGVHESIHTTDLEQINIDRNRDIDAEDKIVAYIGIMRRNQ